MVRAVWCVLVCALCASAVVVPKPNTSASEDTKYINKNNNTKEKDQQNAETKDASSARLGQYFYTEDQGSLNDQDHHDSVHLSVHGNHGIKTHLDIGEHHDQGNHVASSGSHLTSGNDIKEGTHHVEYLAYHHQEPSGVHVQHTQYQHTQHPPHLFTQQQHHQQHQQQTLFAPSVGFPGGSVGLSGGNVGLSGGSSHESSQHSFESEYLPEPHHEQHHHPEPIHHSQYPVAHRHKNNNFQLKRVLIPLAGIALLGAAAALATNPVLLQLGVVSGKRRRRSVAAPMQHRALEDMLSEETTLQPDFEDDEDNESGEQEDEDVDAEDFANVTRTIQDDPDLSLRMRELKVLQSFLKAQANEPGRRSGLTAPADGALASLLTCSGLMNSRTTVCLQRMACEAHSEETNLPQLEMEVIKIVLREMMSHEAITSEVKVRVNNAMTAGSKGHRCDAIYRCPTKAWTRCTEPPPPSKKPYRRRP